VFVVRSSHNMEGTKQYEIGNKIEKLKIEIEIEN